MSRCGRSSRKSTSPPADPSTAWTFGALAGPAIVARVGDTLSVHLANVDLDVGCHRALARLPRGERRSTASPG